MKKQKEKKSTMSGKQKTKGEIGAGGRRARLRDILELMHEFHVDELVIPDDVHIRMNATGFKQTPLEYQISLQQSKKEHEHPKDPTMNPMTEDEILFWSAGGSGFKDTGGKEVPVPLTGEEIGDEARDE